VSTDDVIRAWDVAHPDAIHPARSISEDAYWNSGRAQAELLATVLPAGIRVVDFGCGDGRVAIPLRRLGYDVTGADASNSMLARLTERDPEMPTVNSRGTDLYQALGKKTDALVSLAVLIHYGYADAMELLAGLRDAVRANGLLVLDWPTADEPTEAGSWIGVTTWSPQAQADACARLGLKPLDSELPWGVYRAVKAA
jgi:2-polyprenyl-3-methyl-5-hydroxy-6-metoxy-1,4-benzoquinol methylase